MNLPEKLAQAWSKKNLIDLKTIDEKYIPKNRSDSHKLQEQFHNSLKKKLSGWKIGLTTSDIQKEQGLDGPLIGRIIDDTILQNPLEIKLSDVPHCMLECEYALKFLEECKMVPGIENDNSKYEVYISLELTATRINPESKNHLSKQDQMYLAIADNGGAGAIVIGEQIKNFRDINLNQIKVTVDTNGVITKPFFSGNKRAHPNDAIRCITNEFKNNPVIFKKGDWFMSGSIIQPIKVNKGDEFKIDFETLGKFNIKFT